MSNTLNLGDGKWAAKEGSLLAYNSENGNYKPLPFDFSRDSSATVVNKDGLIETVGIGEPRIDYKDDSKGALKLEPSRTNLIQYSEDFSDAYWTKSAASLTDGFISPDGTSNAFKLIEDGTNAFHGFYQNANISLPIGKITMSIFVKANGRDYFQLRTGSAVGVTGAPLYANFDLTNDSVSESSSGVNDAKIESYTNNWKKISISFTVTSVSLVSLVFQPITTSSAAIGETYQGDGTSGVYIYGAQLEEGSYATSYIPTQGSAVTRLRDLSDTQNLSHVIGQTEGVIFYDAILVHKSTDASEDLFELSIDDGSNQNIFFINNYNNTLTVAMVNGGSYQFSNNSFNPTEGARYKLAFAYKQNDFALYINGNQIATDSSGTVTTMNQITFGNYYNNQINLSNSVKVNNLKLYNTRLSNSELQALTT